MKTDNTKSLFFACYCAKERLTDVWYVDIRLKSHGREIGFYHQSSKDGLWHRLISTRYGQTEFLWWFFSELGGEVVFCKFTNFTRIHVDKLFGLVE